MGESVRQPYSYPVPSPMHRLFKISSTGLHKRFTNTDSGFEGENLEVVGEGGGEVLLEAHGPGGPSLRLAEDTVSLDRVHDLRKVTAYEY